MRGGFLEPHTDSATKFASLLLYFPDPEWNDSFDGGTEFYRPLKTAGNENWGNRRVPFDDLESFKLSRYRPNRLIGFAKSKNSYHAVRPLACPGHMCRNSLNINILGYKDYVPSRLTRYTGKVLAKIKNFL